jgi:hypothetical protein
VTCPAQGYKPVGTTCSTGQCDSIGVCAIEQDCTHRWRVATDVYSNLTMYATDKTTVVAGFVKAGGVRADGLADPAGAALWSRPSTGSFGGGFANHFALYQNCGGGATCMGVTDLYDGTPGTSYNYSNVAGSNFSINAYNGSIPAQDGKTSLIVANASGVGPWSTSVSGSDLSGTGPAAILIAHDSLGGVINFVQYADAYASSVKTVALADGRWVLGTGQGAPAVKFGAFSAPANTNELIFLTPKLIFDHAQPTTFSPSVLAAAPSGTLLIASDGGNNLAAYDNTGLLWSRSDCGGTTVAVSGTQVFLVANSSTTFCGRPVPGGVGSGTAVAVLDAKTGATATLRWFPASKAASTGAIGNNGDTYFVYPADTVICGTNNASISVVAY